MPPIKISSRPCPCCRPPVHPSRRYLVHDHDRRADQRGFSKDPDRLQVWEQLTAFERITDYTRILQTNTEMNGIIYYIHDDFVVAGEGATMYRPIGNVAALPWAKKIMAAEGNAVWVLAEDEAAPSTRHLMLGRVLWNVHDLSRPVGIVTVRIELGQLQSYVMNTSAGQLIYLETDDGEVVISSGQDGMEHRVQPLSRPMNRERFEPMTAEIANIWLGTRA